MLSTIRNLTKHWLARPVLLVIAVLLAIPITIAAAAPSTQAERCFPETGFCISGPIRAYWEKNGGLPVFGYPIGPQRQETIEKTWAGPVQWFERDRLEDHGAEGVLAGRLGALYLELSGRPWSPGPSLEPGEETPPGCRFFTETGYGTCGDFLKYWNNNGGLARFGYPITPGFLETIGDGTYLVQYFERRRIELHLENKPPYDILLGLLGKEVKSFGSSVALTPYTRPTV